MLVILVSGQSSPVVQTLHVIARSTYMKTHVSTVTPRPLVSRTESESIVVVVWLFIDTHKRLVDLHSVLKGSRRDGLSSPREQLNK